MTASEVENWGSALLSDDYVCAMISWEYTGSKLNESAMRDAMSALRRKAENHRSRSCSGLSRLSAGCKRGPRPTPRPP